MGIQTERGLPMLDVLEIRDELRELYSTASDDLLGRFAHELCEIITDPGIGLDDIAYYVDEFEAELEDLPERSQFFYVLSLVVSEMPDDEKSARKLFDFFTNNCEDFNVFNKLMIWCREYLSEEEFEQLKEAGRCFDPELLKTCFPDVYG